MADRFRIICVVLPPGRPLCFVRPRALQNRAQEGDSAHFEKN